MGEWVQVVDSGVSLVILIVAAAFFVQRATRSMSQIAEMHRMVSRSCGDLAEMYGKIAKACDQLVSMTDMHRREHAEILKAIREIELAATSATRATRATRAAGAKLRRNG